MHKRHGELKDALIKVAKIYLCMLSRQKMLVFFPANDAVGSLCCDCARVECTFSCHDNSYVLFV